MLKLLSLSAKIFVATPSLESLISVKVFFPSIKSLTINKDHLSPIISKPVAKPQLDLNVELLIF